MISKVLTIIKGSNSLTNINKFGFAIRTSQATVYGHQKKLTEYSREYIRRENEKETLRKQEEERKIQEIKDKWFQNPLNDKNPSNHVKVKINAVSQILQTVESKEVATETERTDLIKPFVVLIQPRPPKITVQGIRRKIQAHMKKTLPLMRAITGQHLYDAMNICLNQKTKASRYVFATLQMVRSHATQKGLDENRLYVIEAVTGKHRRFQSLRYHAKGRSGMQKKNTIQLKIKLEEKPVEEIYKNIIKGKFSPALAHIMRTNLLTEDADYETIRKYQYVLTAKGRQQRKLMFKRRVLKEYLELRATGVKLSKKVIEQKILDEEATNLAEVYRSKKTLDVASALRERQELLKKNEEASV